MWIKNRKDTEQHRLQDAGRGATKNIKSSGTGVEETTSKMQKVLIVMVLHAIRHQVLLMVHTIRCYGIMELAANGQGSANKQTI